MIIKDDGSEQDNYAKSMLGRIEKTPNNTPDIKVIECIECGNLYWWYIDCPPGGCKDHLMNYMSK